jgi:predicted anti-sigma-YlaC factor YlaD
VSHDEIVCREFVELATEYLDGALPDMDLELVEEHLVMCGACRDYLAQVSVTVAAVGAIADEAPADETLRALVGAFAARASDGGSP